MNDTTYSGFVALVGKPNVGKSTLLNALLTIKVAPISPKPQTTRKKVRGIHTEGNRQVVFVDTPGLHQPQDALGSYMSQQIAEALSEVDLVLWVVDLRHPPTPEDQQMAELLGGLAPRVKVLLIGNKLDSARRAESALEAYSHLLPTAETRSLSAHDEGAVAGLRAEVLALLPQGPFFYPQDFSRSDQTPEEWSAEIVREEAMKRLKEEVPYAVAAKTEAFTEREKGKLYIHTILYVEREAHKPILIGKQGRMLKEIGRAARKQLEVFTSQPIYLELEVKVYPNWRRDPEALRELGYI